jgi:hypothetical protein
MGILSEGGFPLRRPGRGMVSWGSLPLRLSPTAKGSALELAEGNDFPQLPPQQGKCNLKAKLL